MVSNFAKAAASLAGAAKDELAKKKGITTSQSQAPTETVMAMRAMAGNLTESELKERINNYKKLKQQHGGLTAGNKTLFDDDVLSLGHGGKEILNNLKDRGVISHNYTSDLSSSEIEPVIEALEYLVEHEQELLQKTKGYNGNQQVRPATTGGAGYVPPLSRTYQDGIVNNNNKPIVSSASNVTKINDGLVQSDPKDVAIFAKEGGVIGNFLNDLYNDVHSANSGTISLDTVNVTISGSLDLSSGGQSVNIINELQTNPMLLRSLSRMLAQQISSAMNGGRGTLSMGIGSV